jgi:hypothetical protein
MSTRVSSESEYSAGSARCQSKRFHNLIGLGPRKLVTGKHVTQACGDVSKRLGFSGSFLIRAADWSHLPSPFSDQKAEFLDCFALRCKVRDSG